MKPAATHLQYEFNGSREYCLSFGDAGAARSILIVPPLFDEMNRVRRVLVQSMRLLAASGVQTLLADLPGCNESEAEISLQSLADWQQAVAAAAQQLSATHIVSIRGGCLIDHGPPLPHWRLAPAKGSSLLKTMLRTKIAAEKESGRDVTIEQLMTSAQSGSLELSGYVLGMAMLESLDSATPVTIANVREAALADVAGTPLWLRAEPQDSTEMATGIAADLDRWSAQCGG